MNILYGFRGIQRQPSVAVRLEPRAELHKTASQGQDQASPVWVKQVDVSIASSSRKGGEGGGKTEAHKTERRLKS